MFYNTIITENFKNISKICPIKKIQFYNSEITIIVQSEDILEILLFFKNHFLCQFKILTCISGVDYPKNSHRFVIIYELLTVKYNSRLKIKIFSSELASISSSMKIFPSADWFEAEIWDMFGIFFKNHVNLKRILTDYGFQGFPLRKDFPLSGFVEMRYNEKQKRVINELLEFSQEYRTFHYVFSSFN